MNDSDIKKDDLAQIFEEASALPHENVRAQLSYTQMFILADTFIRWAMESETTPDRAVQLIGWARGMCRLAETVGEEWSPPEPERLSVMGFMARRYEKHIRQTMDSVEAEG